MPMRKYKPEQIVTLLRQVEVELANGKTTPQACKEAEITAQTYYRWYKKPRSRQAHVQHLWALRISLQRDSK